MVKSKPCYLKAVVIVHGKSEKQICDYIKSNLRLKMEVVSEKKGEKSIQINSLKNILNDSRFRSFNDFITHFDDAEIVYINKKKKLSPDFKIFIIMDTDDCTDKRKSEYISKSMFKDHWAYDYIVPIYDTPDLESVLVKAKIPFEKKGVERKKEYIKIFPTNSKYTISEASELNNFCSNLKKVKETNMDEFVEFCLGKV
ncbi:hypothetical protein CLHUN_31130 [Ruminiclostridium hungatei]|uniref:Uncharacterized protein n=1 Tax=Ruminiclostridium hungatei TaxID=48256 RepID=A0A1V4SGF3_RUMHU|nr:hypothetical protein [Ruminiclostridium hungatei]OPX42969.1 hypothetical protein CLHUN_31130 [Ruminiclostridium hungatei]